MWNFSEAFDINPIIGVVRGIGKKHLTKAIEAAVDGGINCVEIAMNSPDAIQLINLASVYFEKNCCIGAGTVLTCDECKAAIDAGARYIIAPNSQKEIIDICKSSGIPVIPGALTPTEVYQAWSFGASMVKLFPVGSVGGPDYIKELKGPYNHIPFVAFSGISLDKVDDYFLAGVSGIGLGKRLFNSDWVKDGQFDKIKNCAQDYTKAVTKYKNILEKRAKEGKSS